jgi:D-alanine-D-alanine ligase
VLGGTAPLASVVGEVTVTGGWFDHDQKYHADADPMIVPAALPNDVTEAVRELSVRAFRATGCWGLARVDFLWDPGRALPIVNEINTVPGFTAHSMYPKVWEASGVDYAGLLVRLIDLAVERHARRATRAA